MGNVLRYGFGSDFRLMCPFARDANCKLGFLRRGSQQERANRVVGENIKKEYSPWFADISARPARPSPTGTSLPDRPTTEESSRFNVAND